MTLVIIRRVQDELVAFFPSQVSTNDTDMMMSYQIIGQHGSASEQCLEESEEITTDDKEEVSNLIGELITLGYKLTRTSVWFNFTPENLTHWRLERIRKLYK